MQPRYLPVYMQLPSMGFTIAVMDTNGNVIIKSDQPSSPFDGGVNPSIKLETAVQEVHRLRIALAEIADDEDTDAQTAVFAKNTLAIDRIAS